MNFVEDVESHLTFNVKNTFIDAKIVERRIGRPRCYTDSEIIKDQKGRVDDAATEIGSDSESVALSEQEFTTIMLRNLPKKFDSRPFACHAR